jgi:hypothetical protein
MKFNTFEDLQALGTEKIHERTHISRDKVELVMTKSYGEIGRVQFMGYLSILEREYEIDLNDLRNEYTEFCKTHATLIPPKESVILQSVSNSKPKWIVAGLILIALVMSVGYFLQGKMSAMPQEEVMELTTSSVEVADEINITESNQTNALIPTITDVNKSEVIPVNASGKELTIRPIYKVWYGMINMATGERIQNITAEPILIDTSKNWLIFLGHGRLEIDASSEKTVLKEKETVRFLLENGVLKQITKDEFIARNGGKNW